MLKVGSRIGVHDLTTDPAPFVQAPEVPSELVMVVFAILPIREYKLSTRSSSVCFYLGITERRVASCIILMVATLIALGILVW